MQSLTRLAFKNFRFVIVMTTAALALGIMGYLQMPRQEDPNMSAFGAIVTVIYPGAPVDEVEDRVLEPLEEELNELEEVETIESTVRPGVATVVAEFREEVDKERAYDLLVQRLNASEREFPDGVLEVHSRPMKPSQVNVIEVAVHGQVDSETLRVWARELEARLRVLPDARVVELYGEIEREVHVVAAPSRLSAAGLTLSDLYSSLDAANGNVPGGIVHAGGRRLAVRPLPRFESLDDVERTVLRTVDGRPVRVSDVASVSWGGADPSHLVFHNGDPAVLVTVTLKEEHNVLDLAEDAHETIEQFVTALPPEVRATIVVDQSDDVRSRLRTFGTSLLQGGLAISFFVALLAGWRPALAVVSALLLSVGISFWLMEAFGVALQQMSIAGLVVVLGLLVDNAIVVVESILQSRRSGTSIRQAAIEGTDRVASAIASSTATTIAAFVPMMRTAGTVGEFTRDIPTVVTLVLVVSLIVALFLTPMITSRLIQSGNPGPSMSGWISRVVVTGMYKKVMHSAVARPKRAAILVLLGGLLPFAAAGGVGMNFFPAAEKPVFMTRIISPEGASLSATRERAGNVEAWYLEQPEVLSVTTNVGEGNPMIYYNHLRMPNASNQAELLVTVSREDIMTIPELARRARSTFGAHPDFVLETKVFNQGPLIGLPVSVQLIGNDLPRLSAHADELAAALRDIPGAINVFNGMSPGAPRLDLEIDPVMVDRLGLDGRFVAQEVRLALAGGTATQLREGDEDHDVVVRVAREGEESIVDLERLRLPGAAGGITLAQVTRPTLSPTYSQIAHRDLKRSVLVGSDVDGRLATDVMTELLPALQGLDLGPEESYLVIGEDEERDRAFISMLMNLIVAAGLIYGVLVLQFRSFIHPLVIFTSIPIAYGGSILALFVSGWSFGFTAFIGLLALTGIVVNNAIVLVDRINQLRRDGHSLVESVIEGTAARFQPILLTTLTTIAGLFPLTLTGGSMWGPMGWVVIGGLVSSTAVTLVLVPTLYFVIERRQDATAKDTAGSEDADRGSDPSEREFSHEHNAGLLRPTPGLTVLLLILGLGFGSVPLVGQAQAQIRDVTLTTEPSLSDTLHLSLEQLVERVDQENLDLAALREAVRAADAALSVAKAARWPTLSLDAGWQSTDDPAQTFGLTLSTGGNPLETPLDQSVDVLTGSLGARWVLWDPVRGPKVSQTRARRDGQIHSVESTRSYLRFQAIQAYFLLVEAAQEVKVQASIRALVDRETEDTELRVGAGRSLQSDLLGLKARQAAIMADYAAVEGRLEITRARLAELLGLDPRQPIGFDAEADVPELLVGSLEEARTAARERRPEIAAARAALAGTDSGVDAAWKQRLPSLVGKAAYNSVTAEREFENESHYYAAAIGVEWIPFRGGAIHAETQMAKAERERTRKNLEAVELEIDREIVESWTRRETASRQVEAATFGLEAAEEAYRIVVLRYREGRDTFTRFLAAELALTEASTRLVQARAALEIAEARLRWATGTPILP